MICLDTSFWIECFVKGPQAEKVIPFLRKPDEIVLPTICLVETGRYLARNVDEVMGHEYLQSMLNANVVPLDEDLAQEAARIGIELKLPLADSIIYVTAREYDAELWTLDADFKDLGGVKYFPKKSK